MALNYPNSRQPPERHTLRSLYHPYLYDQQARRGWILRVLENEPTSSPNTGSHHHASPPLIPSPSQAVFAIPRPHSDATHQAQPSSGGPPSVTPDDPLTESIEPERVPQGYPRALEILRDQHAATDAQILLAKAKAAWIEAQALKERTQALKARAELLKTRAELLDRLLDREEARRLQRLRLAMETIRSPTVSHVVRQHVGSWVVQNFHSGNLEEEYARPFMRWSRELSLDIVTDTEPTEAQTPPIPPIPPVSSPDMLDETTTAI